MSRPARSGEGTRRGRCEMTGIRLPADGTVTTAECGREFWRSTLLAGASTALPRWSHDSAGDVGEHDTRIPDELVAALRRVAGQPAGAPGTGFLTAPAQGASALFGGWGVSTRYVVTKGPSPLVCR